MTATSATASAPATRPQRTALLRVFQGFSVLAALNVLFQYVTAGQLFPQGGPEEAHAAGAIVLHVVNGVAAVCAFLLWRRQQVTTRLLALAVAVFAFTFVQAAMGGRSSLAVHIPGAMVLTFGVTWQLLAALGLSRRGPGPAGGGTERAA